MFSSSTALTVKFTPIATSIVKLFWDVPEHLVSKTLLPVVSFIFYILGGESRTGRLRQAVLNFSFRW